MMRIGSRHAKLVPKKRGKMSYLKALWRDEAFSWCLNVLFGVFNKLYRTFFLIFFNCKFFNCEFFNFVIRTLSLDPDSVTCLDPDQDSVNLDL
jgi:hypothetical protein